MERLKGKLYLMGAFSLAGTSTISGRFVTGKLGTFTITAVSLFFALLFLIPLCKKQLLHYLRRMSISNFIFLTLQAFCGIFLFRLFLLSALTYTSTGEAGILTGAAPAITALLAIFLLKEPVNGRKLAGIFCTVGGILVLQGLLTPGNGLSLEHLGGNMLVLCAAACESTFNTLSRVSAVKAMGGQTGTSDPIAQTTVVSAIALALCLIPALFEHPVQRLAGIGLREWTALFWYGIFVTALAFICWYAGIRRCGAFTAAAFSGMMPFTAMLLSTALLGEHMNGWQWLGGFCVIAGMFLIGSEGIAWKLFPSKSGKTKTKKPVEN